MREHIYFGGALKPTSEKNEFYSYMRAERITL